MLYKNTYLMPNENDGSNETCWSKVLEVKVDQCKISICEQNDIQRHMFMNNENDGFDERCQSKVLEVKVEQCKIIFCEHNVV